MSLICPATGSSASAHRAPSRSAAAGPPCARPRPPLRVPPWRATLPAACPLTRGGCHAGGVKPPTGGGSPSSARPVVAAAGEGSGARGDAGPVPGVPWLAVPYPGVPLSRRATRSWPPRGRAVRPGQRTDTRRAPCRAAEAVRRARPPRRRAGGRIPRRDRRLELPAAAQVAARDGGRLVGQAGQFQRRSPRGQHGRHHGRRAAAGPQPLLDDERAREDVTQPLALGRQQRRDQRGRTQQQPDFQHGRQRADQRLAGSVPARRRPRRPAGPS